MPNMKAIINSHNHKIISPEVITKKRTCNCADKAKCPLSQTASLTTSFTSSINVNQPTLQRKNLLRHS